MTSFNTRLLRRVCTGLLVFAAVSAGHLPSAMADAKEVSAQVMKALLPASRSKFVDFAEKTLYAGESAKFMRDHLIYMEATASERPRLARVIFDKYLKAGSNREINISATMRTDIEKGLERAQPSLFQPAFKEVLTLVSDNIDRSHAKAWQAWVAGNLK